MQYSFFVICIFNYFLSVFDIFLRISLTMQYSYQAPNYNYTLTTGMNTYMAV